MTSTIFFMVLKNKESDFMDKYNFNALYLPAIFLMIPIVFVIEVLRIDTNKLIETMGKVNYEFDGVTITAGIVSWIFFFKVIRYIGKHFVENRIFENGNKFPTTEYLTKDSNELSSAIKTKIFHHLELDFKLDLSHLNKLSGKEELKEINSLVGSIRRKVKDGTLTLKRNIDYGQARNFIGGLFIAVPIITLCNIYCIYYSQYGIIEDTLFGINFVFILILLFHKSIIKKFADEYARMLFDDYITQGRN